MASNWCRLMKYKPPISLACMPSSQHNTDIVRVLFCVLCHLPLVLKIEFQCLISQLYLRETFNRTSNKSIYRLWAGIYWFLFILFAYTRFLFRDSVNAKSPKHTHTHSLLEHDHTLVFHLIPSSFQIPLHYRECGCLVFARVLTFGIY